MTLPLSFRKWTMRRSKASVRPCLPTSWVEVAETVRMKKNLAALRVCSSSSAPVRCEDPRVEVSQRLETAVADLLALEPAQVADVQARRRSVAELTSSTDSGTACRSESVTNIDGMSLILPTKLSRSSETKRSYRFPSVRRKSRSTVSTR
jgi:hypothetical protein